MKFPPIQILKCFLLFLFCSCFFANDIFSKINTLNAKEDADFIIKTSKKNLEFFLTKENKLGAKLKVIQTIVSQTSLSAKFSRAVFFDENSSVSNVLVKANRKTLRMQPIISDYESDGIFHSDLKICFFEHKTNKEGEVIEISYQKTFSDYRFLDPLYFNDSYPVESSIISVLIPDWLELDIRKMNFDLEMPKTNSLEEKKSKRINWLLKNVSAASRSTSAPRRSKINAHLIVIPEEIEVEGEKRRLLKDVSDLYAWYASLVKEIGNDNTNLKNLVLELTASKTDDYEKIKAIFYWVQDNIRYVAFENGIMGFRPENCQNVLGNKFGDCKGMANLTKEMLKIAGYDARLTWLGTADVPYTYEIPSLLVDNHMICTVILNDEKIYLDPTEKYSELYNYAHRIQGQEVLIENGSEFFIERIPVSEPLKHQEKMEVNLSLSGSKLEGAGAVEFEGNRKTRIFNYMSIYPESDWEDFFTRFVNNQDKNISVNLQSIPNLDNRESAAKVAFEVQLDNHVIDLGSEQYINLELDYHFQKFEIPADRKVGYEFGGRYAIQTTTNFEIPEGWKTTYLPESINIQHDKYVFNLNFEETDSKIIYHKLIVLKDTYLAPKDFEAWNTAIQKIQTFYGDQIILEKL